MHQQLNFDNLPVTNYILHKEAAFPTRKARQEARDHGPSCYLMVRPTSCSVVVFAAAVWNIKLFANTI